MKRILALVMATLMMISSTIVVCAAQPANDGSYSPEAEIKELQKEIKQLEKQIAALTSAITAKSGGGGGGSTSRGSGGSSQTSSGNSVSYGGNIVYQGGKIEINGGKSNITFTIKAPSSGTLSSANKLANSLGGSLINCINTSSPGASFTSAKVNFFISGVQAGDNIAVYQAQGGTWVQLPVAEIRKDHVVVNMTRHGDLAFVIVPVLASATN